MTTPARADRSPGRTLARIENGLRMVTVPLPHLAGLAGAVRVAIDDRVPTMGVFASGRIVANRDFVARLKDDELVFVLAHELLHLALRTHDRAKGSGQLEFNYAHDYIINDILRVELGVDAIPAGGLDMPGAREKSAEQIVLAFRKGGSQMRSQTQVWEGQVVAATRIFGGDRQRAGQCRGERRIRRGQPGGGRARRQARARLVPHRHRRSGRPGEAHGGAGGQGARPRQGAGGDEGARHRDRRIEPAHVGAARDLPHALADGVAEMAGVGCPGRADLRAPVAAGVPTDPIWSSPDASARPGCSTCCWTPAAP